MVEVVALGNERPARVAGCRVAYETRRQHARNRAKKDAA